MKNNISDVIKAFQSIQQTYGDVPVSIQSINVLDGYSDIPVSVAVANADEFQGETFDISVKTVSGKEVIITDGLETYNGGARVSATVELEVDSEIFCDNFGYDVTQYSLGKSDLEALSDPEPCEDEGEDEDDVKDRLKLYDEIKDTPEYKAVIGGKAKYLSLYRDTF